MTTVKRIRFQTTIEAAVDLVWGVMLGKETYPRWTAAFAEGSYYEGTWSKGERIRFLAPPGDGMLAEIAEIRPNEFISIRHLGYIVNGVEDTESDSVRAWAPAFEDYSFRSVPGGTELVIDQEVTADFEQFMKEAWPKALELLKSLCETSGDA